MHNVLAARPIGLRARERGYRLRCFVRRHRVAVAAGAIVAIVAVTALVLILVQSRHVAAARAVAESERDHARGVTEFLVNAFGNVNAFRMRSRGVLASELLESAAHELHNRSREDAELTTAVGQTLAQLHLRLDMIEPARAQAALAREALGRLPEASTLLRVRQSGVEAEIALQDSRFRDVLAAVETAAATMAADPAFRDAEIEIRLAMVGAQARRFSANPLEASAGLRRSYEAFRQRSDITPARLEPMLKLLARHLVNDGDPAEGLALLDEVLAAQRKRLPDDDAAVIETIYGRGQALYRLRRNDGAIAAYETAVAGFRKQYGSDYIELSNMLGDLGTLYVEVGRSAEADRLLREALRITLARGKSRRNVAGLYDQFAGLYRDGFHDYAAAQRYAGLAYAMTPPESRDSRAYTSRGLAETLLANGDWFEGMLHAESALPYMVDSCGNCQQVAYLRGDVAYARLRLYDLAGAREWLTRDTLTTLRVWSRWPHNVRMRAEDIARTVGTAVEAD
ncbi:MAG TPA: tetratricopeptide repeat protein [Tahibacter sp.]|nr:tetratricopeptide repeat protein [Tahibacter sp.]